MVHPVQGAAHHGRQLWRVLNNVHMGKDRFEARFGIPKVKGIQFPLRCVMIIRLAKETSVL